MPAAPFALLLIAAVLGACSGGLRLPWSDDVEKVPVVLEGMDGEIFAGLIESYNLADPLEVREQNTPRAAAARRARIGQALESRGYFNHRLRHQVVSGTEAATQVLYTVRPGDPYLLGSVSLAWEGGVPANPPTPALVTGGPVDMDAILAEATRLGQAVQEQACPISLRVRPAMVLDPDAERANLTYTIERGASATFGDVNITGTERVKDKVVFRALTWKAGDCFRLDDVARSEEALRGTQLFSTIEISASAPDAAGGPAPVTITLKERAARRLRLGVYGSSADGPSVGAGWDHRNFFGGGESFTSSLNLGQAEQRISAGLRQPHWMTENLTLATRAGLKQESRDTYNATTLDGSAMLERPILIDNLTGGLGVGATFTKSRSPGEAEAKYALLSFPGFLHHDTRNSVLDPTRGHSLRLDVTPYTETVGDGGNFVKSVASGRVYLTANTAPTSPTLALRTSVGTINMAEGRDIPADLRFYAGGGNSVRGYGYQTLGPRVLGKPSGGNSLFEASAEVRSRFTDTLGGVAFVDAGNVSDDPTPQFDVLQYAAGIGVRYQTPMGPLRADVAVPLNGKDVGAAPYALYFSIGQAF